MRPSTKEPVGLFDEFAAASENEFSRLFRRGTRDLGPTHGFVSDLASRLRHRVQLTTDGHRPYLSAVEDAFGADIDYAVLQKLYGADPENERRYSPSKCLGVECKIVTGDPDPKHISTSYVERQNWTVRTTMHRYSRLSYGFNRKLENHAAAVALNYFAYNFIKMHRTLRMTPAMAAGVTTRLWDVSDLVALLESAIQESSVSEIARMEPYDRWFVLVMGICFLVFAKPYGRALGNGLEGPWTPEKRASDARRHTFIARILGAALVAFAIWRFVGL